MIAVLILVCTLQVQPQVAPANFVRTLGLQGNDQISRLKIEAIGKMLGTLVFAQADKHPDGSSFLAIITAKDRARELQWNVLQDADLNANCLALFAPTMVDRFFSLPLLSERAALGNGLDKVRFKSAPLQEALKKCAPFAKRETSKNGLQLVAVMGAERSFDASDGKRLQAFDFFLVMSSDDPVRSAVYRYQVIDGQAVTCGRIMRSPDPYLSEPRSQSAGGVGGGGRDPVSLSIREAVQSVMTGTNHSDSQGILSLNLSPPLFNVGSVVGHLLRKSTKVQRWVESYAAITDRP